MIITYGNPPTLLCRGGNEQPIGLDKQDERSVQVVQPMEAEGVDPIGRANKQTVVSFAVLREHADYSASELFWLTHDDDLPDEGTLSLRPETAGVVNYPAALQRSRTTLLGATTTTQYTFICGASL